MSSRILRHQVIIFTSVVCMTWSPLVAPEYNGRNIDGILFDATVYSYSTGKYYDVQVEFDGDEATIYFSNGGSIVVTLDDEVIEDPHDISAFDYERGVYWDLDIDDLD
jgi:hypothetical protein